MLYYEDLYRQFFEAYPRESATLIGVSGYLGLSTVQRLEGVSYRSTLIYGMQSEQSKSAQEKKLHEGLCGLHGRQISILYPSITTHSKCYVWLDEEQKPLRGLVGSANFSANAFYSSWRETLIEVDKPHLGFVKAYIERIIDESIPCLDYGFGDPGAEPDPIREDTPLLEISLELYSTRDGEVPSKSHLNWCLADAHVSENDAYIAIRQDHVLSAPNFFPPRLPVDKRRRGQADDALEILWDDGTFMTITFEGTQQVKGRTYPKQLSSHPEKSLLGEYLRRRIGTPYPAKVRRADLLAYGRDTIDVSRLHDGTLFFDFST